MKEEERASQGQHLSSVLSARMMGSHRHHNLPFGCKFNCPEPSLQSIIDSLITDDPNGVHGIGLPNFINQQPTPTGQPLLNDQENEEMHDFFSTFESETQSHGHHMPGHFSDDMGQMPLQVQMPHTYVGHETYVRSPSMEWHSHQMNGFQFSNQINHLNAQTPTSPFGNHHHHHQVASPANHMFPLNQNNMQSFASGWQQNFPNHTVPSGRPDMHFGSDPNFLNSGYAAPDGSIEADMSLINYAMAPTSSASNTQPNSRPGSNGNTEPSSPVTTKRRRLNVFQNDQLRMTNGTVANGMTTKQSPPSTNRKRKSFVKHEQQPITPLSKTPTVHGEDELVDEDAEYEEDFEDEQVRSPSPPAPWPASKAPPIQKPPLPPKSSKSRKKSQSSASPAKPKPRRASSSATTMTRTPLTAEQKKANHTNSEQRRRDATAKSYADLYDLVPEIQQMGKQSTMKKLEVVVDKVTTIKQQLEHMRLLLGRDPVTGQPVPGQIANNQYRGDLTHLSGW